MCNTQVGFTGSDCRDLCSQGQMTLAWVVIVSILGLFGSAAFVYFVYRNFSRRKSGRTPSLTTLLTLTFAGGGMFLLGIYGILSGCNSVGFPNFSIIMEDSSGRIIRRSRPGLNSTAYIMYGIAACFGTCSLFILSLAWIGVIVSFDHHIVRIARTWQLILFNCI